MRLLVFAVLTGAVIAGPTVRNQETCVSECSNDQKFRYEIGQAYEYRYEADTIIGIENTFDDTARLKVSTTAHIQPTSPCEFVLKLSDTALQGSSKSSEFSRAVERRPLTFNFDNGVVKHICGASSEEPWVLNFKKGLLSTLQNSMTQMEGKETVVETDISGKCETHYNTWKEGTSVFIQKEKTPSTCTRTPQSFSKLTSFGYDADTLLRGFSPISSQQMCKQELSSGLIHTSKCDETHLFKPFSKEGKGAYTKTSTNLIFRQSRVATPIFVADTLLKTDLLFIDTGKVSEKSVVEDILDQLQEVSETGVTKDVPVLFSQLIEGLKFLTFSEIDSLFMEYHDRTTRKFLVDAMPLVGTSASMESMGKLIEMGYLTETEIDTWFTGLAFIDNPTLDMIDALESPVKKIKNYANYLGVSSLIHNYCKKDGDCSTKKPVTDIISHLETMISNGCHYSDTAEREKIMFVLKAIGNAGVFVNGQEYLTKCYREENCMEVRVAAMQAYRRTSCDVDRTDFLDLFKDQDQDSEIRIAAYLELMNCPTRDLISVLRTSLSTEEVNQVGSFVWTHLSNLQETAANDKQWLRQLVGIESLQKKFNTNALKFSRNFESSFFLDEQKIGGSAEANVIFSSKSFLPRSAMFNLTVDVFGQAVNLFEVGGRIYGFEKYIEKFFGPDGYYPDDTMTEIINNLKEANEEIEKDPKGSYYFRIFGNELLYRSFSGLEGLLPKLNARDLIEYLLKFTSKDGIQFSKNYNFVDTEFNFPTITGFPVNMKLNGSANVDFKLEGDFNVNGINSFDVHGKVKPSAVVRMDSAMAVDAFVTKSGMKMVSTMFSSTAFDGRLHIEGGKLIDFAIKVPDTKSEVYDFSNEFFRIEDDDLIEEQGEVQTSENCYKPLYGKLGIEICYQKTYSSSDDTKPYFPLNGPFQRRVFVQKTKEFSGYAFNFFREDGEFNIYIDMVGAKDSKWHLRFDRYNGNGYGIVVDTPYSHLEGHAVVKRQEDGVSASVKLNDYEGTLDCRRNVGHFMNHRCLLHLSNDSEDLISYSSQFSHDVDEGSTSGDFTLSGRYLPKTNINLSIDRRPDLRTIEFHVSSPIIQTSLSGFLRRNTDYFAIKLDGSYSYRDFPPRTLHTSVRYLRKEENGFKIYAVSGELKELAMDFNWETKVGDNSVQNKASAKYFGGSVNFEQSAVYKRMTEKGAEYQLKARLDAPEYGTKFLLDKSIVKRPGFYQSKGRMEYNNYKHKHEMTWTRGKEVSIEIDSNLHGSPYIVKLQINSVADGFYKVQISLETALRTYKLEGSFMNGSTGNKFDVKLDGNVEFSGGRYRFESGVLASPSEFSLKAKAESESGRIHYLTIKASRSEIVFDTNIHRTVSAVAKIEFENDKIFDFETVYQGREVAKAKFAYTGKSLEGSLKMADVDVGILAKLEDNGCQFKVQWTPTDVVDFQLTFTRRPEFSVAAQLDTPFQGFEKQDLKLDFKREPNKILSRFSCNWQNTHHLSVVFDSFYKTESGTVLKSNFRMTSSVEKFELVEIKLDYSRVFTTFRGTLDGKWNDQVMEGKLTAMPTENGYMTELTFESPFTHKLEYHFNYSRTSTHLSTAFLFMYGSKKSQIDFKLDRSDPNNKTGSFVVTGIYLPDINLNGFVKKIDGNVRTELKGTVNEQKVFFASSCETAVLKEDRICKMSLKFMIPSGKVFNFASSAVFKPNRAFEIDVKVSPLFISEEEIRVDIDGKFHSVQDSFLNIKSIGPLNIDVKFKHAVSDKKLLTTFSSIFNQFSLDLTADGHVEDFRNLFGSFEITTVSTCPNLDGILIKIERDSTGQARNTLVNIRKGKFVAKIYNSMTFQDRWNWHNTLIVNDIYSFKTSLERYGHVLKHEMQYTWGENIVESFVELKKTDRYEVTVSFASPWTSLLKLKGARKRTSDNIVGEWKFTYGHTREFEASADYDIAFGSHYNYKLVTSYSGCPWTPMTIDIASSVNGMNKQIDIEAQFSDQLLVHGQFGADETAFSGDFDFDGKFVPQRTEIKSKYVAEARQVILNVNVGEISYNMKIENRKGEIYFSHFYVPFVTTRTYQTQIDFNFDTKPFSLSVLSSAEESKRYKLSLTYNVGNFDASFRSYRDDKEIKLSTTWSKQNTERMFEIRINSDIKFIPDSFLKVNYDFENKKMLAWRGNFLSYKTEAEFHKNMNQLYNFNISISGDGDRVELKNEGDVMEGNSLSADGDKYRFVFRRKYSKEMGNFEFEGTQTNSFGMKKEAKVTLNYSLVGGKQVTLSANVDKRKMYFHTSVNDQIPIKFELKIQDSSKRFNEASVIATIDRDNMKLHGYCGKRNFNFELKSHIESPLKGELLFELTSNIPNFIHHSNKVTFNLAERPFSLVFESQNENASKTYSFTLNYDTRSFDLQLRTPLTAYSSVDVVGRYTFDNLILETSFNIHKNTELISASADIDFNTLIPTVKVVLSTPYESIKSFEMNISGTFSGDKQKFDLTCKRNDIRYSIEMFTALTERSGQAKLHINLPMLESKSFNLLHFDLMYDFMEDVKSVKLDIQRGDHSYNYLIKGKVEKNNFQFDLETPFEEARYMHATGRYEIGYSEGVFTSTGAATFYKNETPYHFEGIVAVSDKAISVDGSTPFSDYKKLRIDGVLEENKIVLSFKKEGDLLIKKTISIEYMLGEGKAYLEVKTPFDMISYFAIGGEIDIAGRNVEGRGFVHRNLEKLEMKTKFFTSYEKTFMGVLVEVPEKDEKYGFKIYYDIATDHKKAGIVLDIANWAKKLVVELYIPSDKFDKAFLKISSSYPGYERMGIDYKYSINYETKECNILLSSYRNDEVMAFGFENIFRYNHFLVKVLTPFHDYEQNIIEARLDIDERVGKFILIGGPHHFIVDSHIKKNDFGFVFKSPWTSPLEVNMKYDEKETKDVFFKFMYGKDAKVQLDGSFSPYFSTFEAEVISPITDNVYEFVASYDLLDEEKSVNVKFVSNSIVYKVLTSFEKSDNKAKLKFNLVSPWQNWSDVQFVAGYNLEDKEKALVFTYGRNQNKLINISGRIIDDEVNVSLEYPSETVGQVKATGMLNRAKRSIDFRIMNDHHDHGLIANFNSLKVTMKTPYDQVKEARLEIVKTQKGAWKIDYKRNDRYLTLNVTPQGRKGKAVKVDARLPGWTALLIHGLLKEGELYEYLTYKKTIGDITYSGSGVFGPDKGNYQFTAETPFSNFQKVTGLLEYNTRKRTAKISVISNSSDFHIDYTFKRGSPSIDVFFPFEHHEPTVIKGSFTPFRSSLTMSSRFSALKSLSWSHSINVGNPKVEINALYVRNDIKRFELTMEADNSQQTVHLNIYYDIFGNKATLHIHRMGMESLLLEFTRNDKLFKLDAKASSPRPFVDGRIDFTVENNFRRVPVTVTGNIQFMRNQTPKKVVMELVYPGKKMYAAYFTYNINLGNLRQGDFKINIVTPTRDMRPWKNISGDWSYVDGRLTLNYNRGRAKQIKLTGNIDFKNPRQGKLQWESNIFFPMNTYGVTWKLVKKGTSRNYYVKTERGGRFIEMTFKGKTKRSGEREYAGSFMASRFMQHPLKYTMSWKRSGNELTGDGTFELGEMRGTHKLLYFRRDPVARAAQFKWEASTNIPHYNKINLDGQYSLQDKTVDITLTWDVDNIYVKGSLADFTKATSSQKLTFHAPLIGEGELTFSHDFSNPLSKSMMTTGFISGQEVKYDIRWTRSADYRVFDLTADIKSAILGSNIHAEYGYDASNWKDVKSHLSYNRNDRHTVDWKYSLKITDTSYHEESLLTTSFRFLPRNHYYLHIDWANDFIIDGAIESKDGRIKLDLKLGKGSGTFSLTSPFFEDINADLTYTVNPKERSVYLNYKRGSRIVKFEGKLETPNKKKGVLKVRLNTPFDIVKTLSIDGSWKKGNLKGTYRRNDVEIKVDGNVEVQVKKSSFDIQFNLPKGTPVKFAFNYDLNAFAAGKSKVPADLMSLDLTVGDRSLSMNAKGFRGPKSFSIEFNGITSYERFKILKFALAGNFRDNGADARIEVGVNDFYYKQIDNYERRENGFYIRSNIESSLTRLPGLVLGIGREGDSAIITVGIGTEDAVREVTITIKGKDGFRSGFAGKIDIPRLKIFNVNYDVNYSFNGPDQLEVHITLPAKNGNVVFHILYDSTGVQSRLSSPLYGLHSLRLRRSIENGKFMADIGIDDYGFTIGGVRTDSGFAKGFKLEGQVFGKEILLDTSLKTASDWNLEGKFLVDIPYLRLHKTGCSVKTTSQERLYSGDLNCNLYYEIEGTVDLEKDENMVPNKGKFSLLVNKDLYKLHGYVDRTGKSYDIFASLEAPNTPITLEASFEKLSAVSYAGNASLKFRNDVYKSNFEFERTSGLNGEFNIITPYSDFTHHVKFSVAKDRGIRTVKIELNEHSVLVRYSYDMSVPTVLFDSTVYYSGVGTNSIGFELNGREENIVFHLELQSEHRFKIAGSYGDKKSFQIKTNSKFVPFTFLSVNFLNEVDNIFRLDLTTARGEYVVIVKRKPRDEVEAASIQIDLKSAGRKVYQIDFAYLNEERKELDFEVRREDALVSNFNIAFDLKDGLYCAFQVEQGNSPHTLYIDYNIPSQTLVISGTSRYLPTGALKGEGSFHILSPLSFDVGASLSSSINTYGAYVKVNVESPIEKELKFEIDTPYESYEHIKLGVLFENKDITKAAVLVEPFGFSASAFYGIEESVVKTGLSAKTGIKGWENIDFEAYVPLNTFAPKLSVGIGEKTYGIEGSFDRNDTERNFSYKIIRFSDAHNETVVYDFGLKYTIIAPYKFSYHHNRDSAHKRFSRKFGITVDSSFFSIFTPRATFLS